MTHTLTSTMDLTSYGKAYAEIDFRIHYSITDPEDPQIHEVEVAVIGNRGEWVYAEPGLAGVIQKYALANLVSKMYDAARYDAPAWWGQKADSWKEMRV